MKRIVCLLLALIVGTGVLYSTNATNDGPSHGPERSCSSEFNDKTPTSFLDHGDRCPAETVSPPKPLPTPVAPAWQVPSIIRFNISEVPVTISTKFEEMRNEHAPAIGQFFARYQEEFEDHPNIRWFAFLTLNLIGLIFVILTVISKMVYYGFQWLLWKFYNILPVPEHAGKYANKSKFLITTFRSCLPTITWPCMPGMVTWILSLVSNTVLYWLAPILAAAFALLIAVMIRALFDMVQARMMAPAPIVPPPVIVPPVPAAVVWAPNQIGYQLPVPLTHYGGHHQWFQPPHAAINILHFPTFCGGTVRNYHDATHGRVGIIPTRHEAWSGTIWGGFGNGDQAVTLHALNNIERQWNDYQDAVMPASSIDHYHCLREFILETLRATRYGNTAGSPRCGFKHGLMFVFLHDTVRSPYWGNMNAMHQAYAECIHLDIKRARENHVATQAQIVWRHLQP